MVIIMKKTTKRLYRSKQDKMIAGVCGGIGEYFQVDPVWVRLIAVLLVIANGIGILLYIAGWIIIPENPKQKDTKKTKVEDVADQVVKHAKDKKTHKVVKEKKGRNSFLLGLILVIIGASFLLNNFVSWFSFKYVWPILIILLGLHILFGRKEK